MSEREKAFAIAAKAFSILERGGITLPEVIPHWLTKQATLRPEKVAIETDDGTCITVIELQDMSMSYAKKLAHIGVRRGDHVGVLSMNNIEMGVTIEVIMYVGS